MSRRSRPQSATSSPLNLQPSGALVFECRPQPENRYACDRLRFAEEMTQCRRPFTEPGEGRRPTLTWPRQIPIEGEPPDVVKIVAASADWLSTSRVPKLFFRTEPGAILANDEDLAFIRRLPALTEVKVAGRHYVQEDSPDEIGRAIAGWMGALG
jgi:haloalkane dehalogenase